MNVQRIQRLRRLKSTKYFRMSGCSVWPFGKKGGGGIYLFNGTTLTKLADYNTPIPGGSGNFTTFSDPVISGNDVAFWGGGSAQVGIYLFDGTTLSKVADTNTPVPGVSGNFAGFFEPVIDNGKVAFLGFWGTEQGGIYMATPLDTPRWFWRRLETGTRTIPYLCCRFHIVGGELVLPDFGIGGTGK